MAIALQALSSPSRRRIRLQFSNSLAAGAFDKTKYSVLTADSRGSDATVIAVLVVAGTPSAAELALDVDLVAGAAYNVTALASVPATDASTLGVDTTLPLRTAGAPAIKKLTKQAEAYDELYGTDIAYPGSWQETPDGDLSVVTGIENVAGAIERRVKSEGLPWDPEYGRIAREYVDGPSPSVAELRAKLAVQAQKDDRVIDALAAIIESETLKSGEVWLSLSAQLLGKIEVKTSVPVKVS